MGSARPMENPCKFNDRIIEITGVSGRNGRIGALEKETEQMNQRMEKLETMMLKVLLASAAGGGVVAGLTKLIG